MPTKSILLAVTEPQMLIDITEALGAEWEAISVASEEDALVQFEKRSFDALLVDFNLSSPDASELLNEVSGKHPETVRFLLAYEADLALVASKVEGSPHILPKPVETASLKSRIEKGVQDSTSKEGESKPANAPAAEPPTVPTVYAVVLKAIELPGANSKQVGEIIAGDAALTSEVLRLANSSYLTSPRNITDPVEAVESLGLETVKAVVMALQFLAEHSRLRPGYLSLAQIWQHSINVGLIARDLVLFETKDRTLASQALTAGLLHDLGKVVLATNFDDLYGRVHSLAHKQPVAIWDIEKEMFGANHGEIGGCLLGMWNMPMAVVEATALHHEPPVGEHDELTPLAAVHIANVLERELQTTEDDVPVAPIINTPFLNHLGLLHRLPVWRAALANRSTENLEAEIEAAEAESVETRETGWIVPSSTSRPRSANPLPGLAARRASASRRIRSGDGMPEVHADRYRKTWFYATAVAVVVLALWLRIPPEPNHPELAYARTRHQAPVFSPETTPVATPEVTPAAVISDEPPARPAPSTVQRPAASVTAPQTTAAVPTPTAPAVTATNVPSPTVAPEKKAPEFRLNGIIYSSASPSAIVNGQRVNPGDEVDGATVVGITSTTVTLQINGQRKIYRLR